jgi:hypothetical protein
MGYLSTHIQRATRCVVPLGFGGYFTFLPRSLFLVPRAPVSSSLSPQVRLADPRLLNLPRPPTSSARAQTPSAAPMLPIASTSTSIPRLLLMSVRYWPIAFHWSHSEFAISPPNYAGEYSTSPSSSIVNVSFLFWLFLSTPPSVHTVSSGQ